MKVKDLINNHEPYIIAETAYTHEGDFDYIIRMIETSRNNCNGIKFHLLTNIDQYMKKQHPIYQKLRNWTFTKEQWLKILYHAKNHGLETLCLVDDLDSLEILDQSNCNAICLHGTSINDVLLLDKIRMTDFPVFISLSGVNTYELERTLDFLTKEDKSKEIYLMYGYQNYPSDFNKLELSKINKLKEYFNLQIGYADHTEWDKEVDIKLMEYAYLFGSRIFEKHITLNPGILRTDYESAVHPDYLPKIKNSLHLTKKIISQNHFINTDQTSQRLIGPMKKALVARRDIPKGEIIKSKDLLFKRTDSLTVNDPFNLYFSVLNKKAKEDIRKDEILTLEKTVN
ncbi:N-acetylneuraminate synthase family protein [Metabacillus elymi]|uniref:N-acetylneuraminate synthase family protein n=1 Tax=Metabacillus elymi TaxID=2745198 RepID=A0ABX6S309_9BACI|nr:N-acetylneuraminate synthase family protein [Metabacillus sp. KUDC1714]QNF28484.1 N-acetylneuraminate synthase family protein [Metabacillus sp. KUDC1714]